MHITLIRPQFGTGDGSGYDSPARMEPIALAILKALTPSDVAVSAYDERFERVPVDAPTDLVAMSVCTFSAKRAYELAADYRRRGVPVVMGGFHPTLVPEESLAHADAVARGDAEHAWPRMLADFSAGKLRGVYEPDAPGPCGAVRPDRSIFARKKYLPIRLVQYARGCSRACDFCAIRAFYGGKYRYREVDDVVGELVETSARRVFFVDDNIISDKGAFRALLEAIVKLKLQWTAQIDISIADDAELLALAVKSGCQSLVIGFESLDDENLKLMRKGWNRARDYSRKLARLREAGVMVYGTFVLGYDRDGEDAFSKTLDFAVEEKLFIANFNPLQPFPGTPLYARMKAEGRLVYERWWLEDAYRWHEALIEPKGLSSRALTEGCAWCRARFGSWGNILRRFSGSRANARNLHNAGLYWASNIISKRDIAAKTGMRLGRKER